MLISDVMRNGIEENQTYDEISRGNTKQEKMQQMRGETCKESVRPDGSGSW